MNLKVGGVQKELNLSNDDVDGFAITLTLINDQYNLSDILRNFSYTKEESFTGGGGGFMSVSYTHLPLPTILLV